MHIRRLSFVGALMLFSATGSQAGLTDQHSVQAIAQAISSPIPTSAIEEARKYDDQLLQTATWDGLKVYLVTDGRSQHVHQLVNRLLGAMGEDPAGWVVRILDTSPKVVNAFVAGGKYVYVFTGLVDQAKSDDEIAFFVGHELGHSLLKHGLRQQNDISSMLANLAAIIAATSSGGTQQSALQIAETLHNSYSQIDEREADTFGVLASWHAGFDPLRGADLFSRMERAQDEAVSTRDRQLQDYHDAVLMLQQECQSLTSQWNSGQFEESDENANVVNQRCAAEREHAAVYNNALAQANIEDSQRQLSKLTSDHPDSQERIAAIAALTDYVHGIRPVGSLGAHEQAQRVITALLQKDSALLKPVVLAHQTDTAAPPATKDAADIAARLQKLKEMYQNGLIEQSDYEKKKQELLSQL